MPYEFVDEAPQEEGFLSGLARNATRVTEKVGTRAVGIPGDVLSLVNEYIAKPTVKFATGKEGVPYEQTLLGKALPTTETHRKGIEGLNPEYFKPKNEVERFSDDVIEDTALMLLPGGKAVKSASTIPKKLAISLGANVAGDAIKDAGGTQDASTLAKLGTLFTLSLFDKKSAAKHLSELYKNADNALPPGASVKSGPLLDKLDNLKNKITKGRPIENLAASEKFVLDEIDKIKKLDSQGTLEILKNKIVKGRPLENIEASEKSILREINKIKKFDNHTLDNLKNKITNGKSIDNLAPSQKFVLDEIDKMKKFDNQGRISIDQLWAQKRSLNEELHKQLFETPTKQAQGRARKLATSINGFLRESIDDYGKTNPKFSKNFKAAEEGFGTIAKSNVVSRFVEKNLKYSPITAGLLHMFGGQIGTGAATALIPYQAGKLVYRIAKSPTLAKHYASTVAAAASENAAVFNKELKALDEALQEEESEDKYEFID